MGIDLITVGTMTSVYSLARAITKVGAGFVADNYPPRYLLAITVFSVCLCLFLFLFVHVCLLLFILIIVYSNYCLFNYCLFISFIYLFLFLFFFLGWICKFIIFDFI